MLGSTQLKLELDEGNSGNGDCISIIPFPESSMIKGASIDLHLGRWFSLPHQSKSTHYSFVNPKYSQISAKDYFVDFDRPFVIHPGRFVLAITLEWIRLPKNRAAYVTGKSNIGRRGLVIETAPGVHPNFNGCLTLEIANLGEIPLEVSPGMKICQLFVHQTCDCPIADEDQFSAKIRPTFGRNK
jgi:dCTP deaminase